jgi:GAF domain-containing protein
VSFQLFVRRDNLGALNLYASRPHAFALAAEEVGLLFASHAAVALAGAQREEQLRFALGTRDAIGPA